MNTITYLGFTLMSIMIQFCVMDFIQERIQAPNQEEKPIIMNVSSHRKQFSDILREYTNKPHALYYRTNMNSLTEYKNISTTTKMQSLPETEMSTESSSTPFEVLYDEDASTMGVDTTTELLYTSIDVDNVTEFILFEKKNNTKTEPNATPKRRITNDECNCNFLFKVCDINCCCDRDCSDADVKLFVTCNDKESPGNNDVCYPYFSGNTHKNNGLDNFFCIAKTNLPEKRNINRNKYDAVFVTRAQEATLKWKNIEVSKFDTGFEKKQYIYGDPLWLLKNGTITHLDLPTPVVNNFCTGRKQVQFLKEEKIICSIKLTHLEMIDILKTIEESFVVSVIDRTFNASTLDCSSLHCTNWSVFICDDTSCAPYNKSQHEPFCTDSKCTFIALKMDYIFYFNDFKIVNATVILYTRNVSMMLPFMRQEINVRFYIANESIQHSIRFSGSPGYIYGLPVIASFVGSNHTDDFFNNSSLKKHITLPVNENGKCVTIEARKNFLKFGLNKRVKCRLYFKHTSEFLSRNGTSACKIIDAYIYEYLGINKTIFVSSHGNPYGQKEEDWLPLKIEEINKEIVYGEFYNGKSNLKCHNIVTNVLFIFTYADKSTSADKTHNQIITASVEVTPRNITFNMDDITTVITVDTTFVDVTKQPVYEFAGSPDLNIHLPRDFFFPFPNKSITNKFNLMLLMCICGTVFTKIK